MPWSATKEGTLPSLKNKSLELRSLFAKVANEALADGKSEEYAIRVGLSVIAKEENKRKKLAKATLDEQKRRQSEESASYKPPEHLAVLLEIAKQRKETKLEEEIEKAVVAEKKILKIYFDDYGKLHIVFSDNTEVVSNAVITKEYIKKYISISAPPQRFYEPVTAFNNGNPEVVFTSDGDIVMSEVPTDFYL